jgi:hypothetical protein
MREFREELGVLGSTPDCFADFLDWKEQDVHDKDHGLETGGLRAAAD